MENLTYLIVSDIHGSLSGAAAILNAMEVHHPDYILCLGDILYHGPRNDLPEDYAPKKVIEIMNSISHKIIAVKGNCDGEVDQMVLQFPVLSTTNFIPYHHHFIAMSHGHTYSPDTLPYLQKGDIFLSGHTHIPACIKKDGIYLLNPGSVSLPKQNHPKTYAVLKDNTFTVYTTDYTPYMSIAYSKD